MNIYLLTATCIHYSFAGTVLLCYDFDLHSLGSKSGSGGNHDMAPFQFSYRTEYNVKLTSQEVKYLLSIPP